MGKALYREYRPKSLDTVVGQNHITDTLKNAVGKGAISHAYLFTGPRGVGKTSVARILAHEVNGLEYDENATHLDIIEIDAASNRRIDEIRDLRDKVHIAPTSSKYKVYIIDEVHMLTKEAFNALLKTLEEPPEHAIFILATTEAHKVPETIVSRTQRFSFKPIEGEGAIKHLKHIAKQEKFKITDEALELIVDHGSGSFRDSISMLDQIAGFGLNEITAEEVRQLLGVPDSDAMNNVINAVASGDANQVFDAITVLKQNGVNAAKTASGLITILREQLQNNSIVLSHQKTVCLMKDLLALTGVNGSFETLEITLLDNLDFDASGPAPKQSSKNEPVAAKTTFEKVEKPAPVNVEPPTEEPKTDTASPEPPKPANNQKESKKDDWSAVLKTVKADNNTLYGVLRMADTLIDGDKVILTFRFEFHRKQVTQPKNLDALNKIINSQLNGIYHLDIRVSKKQTNQSPAKKESRTEENKDLKSISNIFGGAELLES